MILRDGVACDRSENVGFAAKALRPVPTAEPAKR
jgi:hypothetical protein